MLKGVVGCGWVRCLGRGFAPVGLNGFALVFFFFEWVCSGGFQIGWVSNRRRWFLTGGFVGLMV